MPNKKRFPQGCVMIWTTTASICICTSTLDKFPLCNLLLEITEYVYLHVKSDTAGQLSQSRRKHFAILNQENTCIWSNGTFTWGRSRHVSISGFQDIQHIQQGFVNQDNNWPPCFWHFQVRFDANERPNTGFPVLNMVDMSWTKRKLLIAVIDAFFCLLQLVHLGGQV